MNARHWVVGVWLGLLPEVALAQADEPKATATSDESPKGNSQVTAEALFQQAKALIRTGNHAAACPKLADSHQLDPAGGTVLTLALCYEETHRLASAWARYQEALAWARQDGRADRAKVAQDRSTALESRLSRITISLGPSVKGIENVVVRHNGIEVGTNALGVPLPVDGGRHEVKVTAPGYQDFQRAMAVVDEKANAVVHVERLEPLEPSVLSAPSKQDVQANAARTPVAKPVADPKSSSGLPTALGYAALGLGAAGLASATYFGLTARGNADDADRLCPGSPCSDQIGVEKNETARDQATIATVSGVVGLVGVGAGIWILLASSETAPQRPPVSVGLGPHGASGHVRLRF